MADNPILWAIGLLVAAGLSFYGLSARLSGKPHPSLAAVCLWLGSCTLSAAAVLWAFHFVPAEASRNAALVAIAAMWILAWCLYRRARRRAVSSGGDIDDIDIDGPFEVVAHESGLPGSSDYARGARHRVYLKIRPERDLLDARILFKFSSNFDSQSVLCGIPEQGHLLSPLPRVPHRVSNLNTVVVDLADRLFSTGSTLRVSANAVDPIEIRQVRLIEEREPDPKFDAARVSLYRQVLSISEAFSHFMNASRRYGKLPPETAEPELGPLRERFGEELRELHSIIKDGRTPIRLGQEYDELRIPVERALRLHPLTRGKELVEPLNDLYALARRDHDWDKDRNPIKATADRRSIADIE